MAVQLTSRRRGYHRLCFAPYSIVMCTKIRLVASSTSRFTLIETKGQQSLVVHGAISWPGNGPREASTPRPSTGSNQHEKNDGLPDLCVLAMPRHGLRWRRGPCTLPSAHDHLACPSRRNAWGGLCRNQWLLLLCHRGRSALRMDLDGGSRFFSCSWSELGIGHRSCFRNSHDHRGASGHGQRQGLKFARHSNQHDLSDYCDRSSCAWDHLPEPAGCHCRLRLRRHWRALPHCLGRRSALYMGLGRECRFLITSGVDFVSHRSDFRARNNDWFVQLHCHRLRFGIPTGSVLGELHDLRQPSDRAGHHFGHAAPRCGRDAVWRVSHGSGAPIFRVPSRCNGWNATVHVDLGRSTGLLPPTGPANLRACFRGLDPMLLEHSGR